MPHLCAQPRCWARRDPRDQLQASWKTPVTKVEAWDSLLQNRCCNLRLARSNLSCVASCQARPMRSHDYFPVYEFYCMLAECCPWCCTAVMYEAVVIVSSSLQLCLRLSGCIGLERVNQVSVCADDPEIEPDVQPWTVLYFCFPVHVQSSTSMGGSGKQSIPSSGSPYTL